MAQFADQVQLHKNANLEKMMVVLNVWILKMNMYHTFNMGFVETLCQYKYNFIPNLISTNTHDLYLWHKLIWKQSTKFLHD